MIRAFQLEWLKLRNYRVFWILMSMYLVALAVTTSFGMFFLEWVKSVGGNLDGIDPTMLPIFDFPDIWQNTTYLASFLKLLLGFIVIISVNNDLTYNTLRQNVIDGISKREFILSKVALILFLASISAVFLFIAGLINGSIYSNVNGMAYMFDELEFIAAYFYEIVVFCSLAFLIALMIKKSGFAIISLFLYTVMFEPILAATLEYTPYFDGTIWQALAPFLPINALNDLIQMPFKKYIFQEIVDNIPISALLISTGWLTIYITAIYYRLTKKDLK
ncbi:MAG: ABC transporter permease [Cyclobacteriaceae bacterium]